MKFFLFCISVILTPLFLFVYAEDPVVPEENGEEIVEEAGGNEEEELPPKVKPTFEPFFPQIENITLSSSPQELASVFPESTVSYFISFDITEIYKPTDQDIAEILHYELDIATEEEEEEEEEENPEEIPSEEISDEIINDFLDLYFPNRHPKISLRFEESDKITSCTSFETEMFPEENGSFQFMVSCDLSENISPLEEISSPAFFLSLEGDAETPLSHGGFLGAEEPKDLDTSFFVSLVLHPRKVLNGKSIQDPNNPNREQIILRGDNLDRTQSQLSLYRSPEREKNVYPNNGEEYYDGLKPEKPKYSYTEDTQISGSLSSYGIKEISSKKYPSLRYISPYTVKQERKTYIQRDGVYLRGLAPSADETTNIFPLVERQNTNLLPPEYKIQLSDNGDFLSFILEYKYSVPQEDKVPKTLPQVSFFNPTDTEIEELWCLSSLESKPIEIVQTVKLPQNYPFLSFVQKSCNITPQYQKTISGENLFHTNLCTSSPDFSVYQKIHTLPSNMNANAFIKNGGSFDFYKNNPELYSYAKNIGVNGEVKGSVATKFIETEWQYELYDILTVTIEYRTYTTHISYGSLSGARYDRTRYITDQIKKSFPIYKWIRKDIKIHSLEGISNAHIDVYSSAAWIQTKGGHMGSNNTIASSGNNEVSFEVLMSQILGDMSTQKMKRSAIAPKDFSPENQHNAELMIFSPKPDIRQSTSGNIHQFTSKAGWYQEIAEETSEGNPFASQENLKRYGYNRYGEEYDDGEFTRDYFEDLLEKEMYGEVISLEKLCEETISDAQCSQILSETFSTSGNIHKTGNSLFIKNRLILPAGKILHTTMQTHFGESLSDLIITGGSARFHIENDVFINGNILYGDMSAKNYFHLPNMRLHARNIRISPNTEYIEMQMKAENEFSTGKSSKQLQILGDVIAQSTFFERDPVVLFSPEDFENNPPSEVIIEDMRKYLIPAPGDTVPRMQDTFWQQVNPSTGELSDPYIDF
jgi:hypothetical protein